MRFPPDAITRTFRFSKFTALRNFLKSTGRPSLQTSRILVENTDSEVANGGRISVRFPPLELRGGSFSQFYGFTGLLKKLFPESPLPMRRIFGQKRRFRGIAGDGRISARSPATITIDFHFSNFTDYGTFKKVISRITTTDGSHFQSKTSISRGRVGGWVGGGQWADFSTIPARCNYEDFSIFQVYGLTELFKSSGRSSLPTSHISAGNIDLEGAPTVVGFQSDFHPLQLRWLYFSNFTVLRNF